MILCIWCVYLSLSHTHTHIHTYIHTYIRMEASIIEQMNANKAIPMLTGFTGHEHIYAFNLADEELIAPISFSNNILMRIYSRMRGILGIFEHALGHCTCHGGLLEHMAGRAQMQFRIMLKLCIIQQCGRSTVCRRYTKKEAMISS